jgi:hypothetical protein
MAIKDVGAPVARLLRIVKPPTAPDELDAFVEAQPFQLELEALIQERRTIRSALVAKLAEECQPRGVPAPKLRSAVVERDDAEEGCDRLTLALSKIGDKAWCPSAIRWDGNGIVMTVTPCVGLCIAPQKGCLTLGDLSRIDNLSTF